MTWWKRVAREPLVHFVILGAVLFAVDRWRGEPELPPPVAPIATPEPATPAAPARTLVIDAERMRQVTEQATRRLGRTPAPAELETELERWITEEILFQEAIARGLERDDPMVRERMVSSMTDVLGQGVVLPEPTDAELKGWFEANHQGSDFEAARPEARRKWLDEQRRLAADAGLRQLRTHWKIDRK